MRKLAVILLMLAAGAFLAPSKLGAQKYSAGVNAADLIYYGTLNAQVGVATGRHVSLEAKGRYNPWEFNHSNVETEIHRKQRTVEFGARYWPWHVYSGWWLGGQARWQEYNRNGLYVSREDLTEEGDAYGVGLSGGYAMMILPDLNVEFGFGMWAGKTWYRSYDCPTCGMPKQEGQKWFVLPNEAILSLVYIF
jgi:hypothetical protein